MTPIPDLQTGLRALRDTWRAEAVEECVDRMPGWVGADAKLRLCADELDALLASLGTTTEEDNHGSLLGSMAAATEQRQSPIAAWQPIETAPKDESRVLLFNPDEAMSSWGVQVGGYYEQLGGWQYDGQNPRYSNAHQPTHWMPLPTPPSPVAQDGASDPGLPEDWPCTFSHHQHANRAEAVECARQRR